MDFSYSTILSNHGLFPTLCLRECESAPIDPALSVKVIAWWLSYSQVNRLSLSEVAYMIHTNGKLWGEHASYGSTVFQRPALTY